jgi:hypothetical protein
VGNGDSGFEGALMKHKGARSFCFSVLNHKDTKKTKLLMCVCLRQTVFERRLSSLPFISLNAKTKAFVFFVPLWFKTLKQKPLSLCAFVFQKNVSKKTKNEASFLHEML